MVTNDLLAAVYADIGHAMSHAAVEVFSTMLEMDVAAGDAKVSKFEPEYHSNVVALLGLTGDWSGSGQISVDPEFACMIASRMLMAEYETVNEDVLDAIAEIANMVIGNIKNILEEKLGPMGLSTPTIVFGGSFETRVAGSPDRVTMPFVCAEGAMHVQIVLAKKHRDSVLSDRLRSAQLALTH